MDKRADAARRRTFYNPDPDYTRPLFQVPPARRERMRARLERLYGRDRAAATLPELERIIQVHCAHKPPEMLEKERHYNPAERFSERDMVLITYGDIVRGDGRTPLAALHRFVGKYNRGVFNTLHLLPFFPYSSDRGFSVVDFSRVDPKLGSWEDIRAHKRRYDLMFDSVLNHCSAENEMFREFRNGNPLYRDFFIAYRSPEELTAEQRRKIFRPRVSDILTRFETIAGPRYVWTTFSADQIDFNFRNPDVLMRILDGVLFYVRCGADILRLDAVTYIWADPGTECIHLPETHEIVKLLRDVLETAASGVAIVTETNVPHAQNVSYFGDGTDEAHMVYNFALPPLVLHTFYRADATALTRWAAGLKCPLGHGDLLQHPRHPRRHRSDGRPGGPARRRHRPHRADRQSATGPSSPSRRPRKGPSPTRSTARGGAPSTPPPAAKTWHFRSGATSPRAAWRSPSPACPGSTSTAPSAARTTSSAPGRPTSRAR